MTDNNAGFDKAFLLGTLYDIEKSIQGLENWSEWNAGIKSGEIQEFKLGYENLCYQLQMVSEKLKD